MAIILNGTTGIATPLGTAAAPSHGDTTNANTGLYFPTGTTAAISTNGLVAVTFDASQNVIGAATVSESVGNVRTIVQNSQTTAYTLVATDNGKFISITTGGVTVPASIFTAGQNIVIYNNSSSVQTITQGASVTMTLGGSTTTGNRSLAGVTSLTLDPTGTYVPYANLTEAQVSAWVQSALGVDGVNSVQSVIDSQITTAANVPTILPNPWG